MKYVIEIQSSSQYLYNCIKSGNILGLIGGENKIIKNEQTKLDALYNIHIDMQYDAFESQAKYYHRYGECLNVISQNQLNTIDWNGICNGCGTSIVDTLIYLYRTCHIFYELSLYSKNLNIYKYTPGSTNCILVVEIDRPYMYNIAFDNLANVFLKFLIYYHENGIIYKTGINDVPNTYIILPDLKNWSYNINADEKNVVKYMIEHGDLTLDMYNILVILVPQYLDELCIFVTKFVDAVYTIQNCWRESRYNPEGNLCKKWCKEIQAKWNKNEF